MILSGILSVLVLCLVYFAYYQMTHVKLPDFTGKDLAEARAWATENKLKLTVEQTYNKEIDINKVISQNSKQGSKLKKGAELTVKSSLGADPEEKVALPDFMTMKKSEAEKWIKDNQADNVSLIDEYSDSIEKGKQSALKL